MPDLGKAYVQIVPSAEGIEGSITNLLGGEAEKAGHSAGSKIAAGIGGALASATAAAAAFAAQAVKVGSGFDAAISQVAATMGLTTAEMQEQVGTVDLAWGEFSGNLREYAQEMGANTAFSATQAAEALNYMALAGYDVQTSMEMLPNVLNLAAAGSMDLARASDMITDTQTAFGISLERTSLLVDEMAKAASTGNTSVEQLGDAFLMVGGLAAELNGGFVTLEDGTEAAVDGVQELEIALTAMANAGVKGSEAGTHMRNMLLKLTSPTKDGYEAMEALGLSVFDTEGNMRSLRDIVGDLSEAFAGMSQESKLNFISDLFNTRDVAAAEALLNAIEQDWDAIGASILEANGAAQQMADTQLDNLQGSVTLLKSAFEGVQIAVSDELTPALREFTDFASGAMTAVGEAVKNGGLAAGIEELGNQLGDGITLIVGYIPQLASAGGQLVTALVTGLLDNAGSIAQAAVDLVSALATGIGENGGELITAAGDAIVIIVTTLTEPENLEKMAGAALDLITGLSDGMVDAWWKIEEALPDIIEIIEDWLNESGTPAIAKAGQDIMKFFSRDWSSIDFQMDVDRFIDKIIGFITKRNQAFIDLGMALARLVLAGLTMGMSEVWFADEIAWLYGKNTSSEPEVPYFSVDASARAVESGNLDRVLSDDLKSGYRIIEESSGKKISQTLIAEDKNALSGYGEGTSYYIDKVEIDASSIREFEDVLTAIDNGRRLGRMANG